MAFSKKLSTLVLFNLAICLALSAQTQDSYDYNSEFTWGINKNTSGGLIAGLNFKKGRKLSDKVVETFGLEIVSVKHPQEVRRSANSTGNFFIYGKSNYLYALRFQYGRDFILFKKASQQGVEIKLVTAIGPTLGIVAPYYIRYSVDGSLYNTQDVQYDPKVHSYEAIQGTGNLFEGLFQSKIQPGANAKVGFNFELGTIKSQVTGFEAGFLIDTYLKKVPIMPSTYNRAVYPTLYFILFYGNRK